MLLITLLLVTEAVMCVLVFRDLDLRWCHLTTGRACFVLECLNHHLWQLLMCG